MESAYTDIDKLKARVPILASSSYADAILLSGILQTAAVIDLRLQAAKYPCPIGIAAEWDLDFSGRPDDGHKVTVHHEYTFVDTVTDPYDVARGADAEAAALNLYSAIEAAATGEYAATTPRNGYCGAYRTSSKVKVRARRYGPAGDAIAVSAGTAPVVVTQTVSGEHEYPVLDALNIYRAAIVLLAGRASGQKSAAANRSLLDDLLEEAKMIEGLIDKGAALKDTEGNVTSRSYTGMHTDCESSFPFADGGHPSRYRHDDNRDFDRN